MISLHKESDSWEGGEALDDEEVASAASETTSDAGASPPIILAASDSRSLNPQAPGDPTEAAFSTTADVS
jgi:hypothetical protein